MITICHQDEDIIIADKPAGMLVHRSWLDVHATEFLLQTLRDQIGQYLYPVHRLDRPTSGLIAFALNIDSARILKAQFDAGEVEKQYLAVVRGWVEEQTIDYALKPKYDKIADADSEKKRESKPAVSIVKPIGRVELAFASSTRYKTSRYTFARLMPKTGRKHQLRRHLKHISNPIVGDTAYGDLRQNKAFAEHLDIKGLLLYAQTLSLTHPITGERITINHVPVDERWQKVFALFNKVN